MRKIAFGYSTACNLRCGHCVAVGDEPSALTLDLKNAVCVIEQLVLAGVKGVSFTAGEPFLYIDEILQLVKLCASKDIYTRIVTNGYWGSSPEKIHTSVNLLKDSGLSQLRLSFSRWHQKQVDKKNIINVAKYCQAIELDCFVSFVTDFGEEDVSLEKYLQDSGVKFFPEPMIYAGRATNITRPVIHTNYPANRCTMNPYLSPGLDMYGCCDAGMHFKNTQFFYLGNLHHESAEILFQKYESNNLYQLIRDVGLTDIASFLGIPSREIIHQRKCELCLKIFNDPKKLKTLCCSLPELLEWKR